MKLTLEIAAAIVAAAALAGCGDGVGDSDAVTRLTQAQLGDMFVVHSCTDSWEERDDLRWYDCSVTDPDPDHDEPRTWTVVVTKDGDIANAQRRR